MSLSEVQRKKQFFEVQIRRKQLDSIFRRMRTNMTLRAEVARALQEFMQDKRPVIPDICIDYARCIDYPELQPFMDLLMNNELKFLQTNSPTNTWFFDCTQVNNLKLAINLCNHQRADHLFANFFYSTVEVYQPYYALFRVLEDELRRSNCLISHEGDQSEVGLALKELNSKEMEVKITALLGFWGAYIGKSHDIILLSTFSMMLNLFMLFVEFCGILSFRETYLFIQNVLGYIIKMNIFSNAKASLNLIPVAEDCWKFIHNVQRRMPFMLKQMVIYGLNFPEIGDILRLFNQLQAYQPGIFFECIFPCYCLKAYIANLLKGPEGGQDDLTGKIVALRLINVLASSDNFISIFQLQGAISLTKTIAQELLFDRRSQLSSLVVLYNLVDGDLLNYFTRIFEDLSYHQLLEDINEEDLPDIFQFLVKIMTVYRQSKVISDKLLGECELEYSMRMFYRARNNQKGYAFLATHIQRNIDYFIQHYLQVVNDLQFHLGEMNFEGMDLVAQRIAEVLALRRREMAL